MLPDWLRDKLASPPEAGAGIHAWLFSVARQLHAHMPPAAVSAALTAATAGAARRVTVREIRDAVQNSHAVAWQRKDFRSGGNGNHHGRDRLVTQASPRDAARGDELPLPASENLRWPKPDAVARRCRIADSAADGVCGLYDLWEQSPRSMEWTADDWLEWLFPDAEWLCLAVDHPATARSRRREKWSFGPADECGLVVPSPMTGPSGKGLDGRTSHRCLDNTGPRRWLVIEFDKGTLDEQAALHWHFRLSAQVSGWPALRLCVHSGGKSLHGWCGPIESEERARDLMGYAATLGADTATWNRCQLVRLPGGKRGAVRQEVFFFDPFLCPSMNSFSVPGDLRDSTPPLVLMAAA